MPAHAGFSRTLLAGLAIAALAVTRAAAEQRELKSDTKEQVDAVLVLDGSGSMRVTDPGRLRDEGAKLFTRFLKSGDRLAIVEFSTSARVIRPLSPYQSDKAAEVEAEIDRVGNSGEYTDLLAGIQQARTMLEADPRDEANPVIILLSDGKMDPDPAVALPATRTGELLNEALPDLKARGIKVHTLAFSEQADRELLAQVALATDGAKYFTPDADRIHQSYAELFVAVKKPQLLQLTGRGFKIDPGIQEATFYVNREEEGGELKILTPEGNTIAFDQRPPNVRWFRGQKFDVITVAAPEPGDWRVEGLPSADGFATVLTNLKLVTDWTNSFPVATRQLLQARLYENEKPVMLPEMAGTIRLALEVTPTDRVSEPIIRDFLRDDGTGGDKIAGDGIFSYRTEFEDPGEYRLKVVARAPTFERVQQLPFRVRPRLATITIIPEHEAGHDHDTGGTHGGVLPELLVGDRIQIKLSNEALMLRRVEVKLTATTKRGRQYVLPVRRVGNDFASSSGALPHDGEFELEAVLSGERKKLGSVREQSRPLLYTRAKPKVVGEKKVEVVVLEKKEKPQSPLPFLLGVLAINALVGVVLLRIVRTAAAGSLATPPEFDSTADVEGAMAVLTRRAAVPEIDLSDPLLAGDEEVPLLEASVAAGAEVVEGGAEAPPAGEGTAGAE